MILNPTLKSEPKAIRIELQYLPSLSYFTALINANIIYLDIDEIYQKQTFRNRCKVLTTNKIDTLTIPIKSYASGTLSKEIQIEYDQDWCRRHWGCFQSAYGKSPYFEFYETELKEIYNKKYKYLVDLNYDLLTFCLRLVGIRNGEMYILSVPEMGSNEVLDLVSKINNKKNNNNHKYYKPTPYYQTFGNGFVEDLSILDLLFNMGPESRGVLVNSSMSL